MKSVIIFTSLILSLLSCKTFWKVIDINQETKNFPTLEKATIVFSQPMNLSYEKSLIVVPEVGNDDTYFKEMISKFNFFHDVIGLDGLENRIIKSNLTNKVPVINDRIGFNNAAKYYKPFLWLHAKMRVDGNKSYEQFILTDALTMNDYFVEEVLYDPYGRGVNDQTVWYPLLNGLSDYLREQVK